MSSRDYRLVTNWRVYGTAEEIFRVLESPSELPRWWPSVYLAVQDLEPGSADGVGREVALVTRGWLPYTLAWVLRVTRVRRPLELAIEAEGDLDGAGVWTLEPAGAWTWVTFEWTVTARNPLLHALSPVLSPALAANHRWAMARGEESLALELARRRAADSSARERVPAPPARARASGIILAGVAAGVFALAAGLVRGRRRRA